MKEVKKSSLKSLVRKFRGKKIMVIGDLMIDRYVWGRVSRISPEAPIPVVEVEKEESKPGGAANVMLNLVSLGAKVYCSGVVGNDREAHELLLYLKKKRINTGGIVTCGKGPTTVKTRVIAHGQQVVRIDKEKKLELSASLIDKIVKKIRPVMKRMDAVIYSDYNKGIFTFESVSEFNDLAKGKIVCVDPKPGNMRFFRNVTFVSPNKKEAGIAAGVNIENDEDLLHAARELRNMINPEAVLITRGEEGMSLYESERMSTVPTVAKEVFDVTGAGDTVISVAALVLASGGSFREAAYLANIGAGIVVGEVGVAVLTPAELSGGINEAQ